MELPYDDLVQLAYLIRAAYTGEAENQKKAMDRLELMGNEPVKFTSAMAQLIVAEEQTTEETIKFKKRTCVYLRSVLASPNCKNKVFQHTNEVMGILLNLLFSDKIEFEFKPLLQTSLILFYSSSSKDFNLHEQGLLLAKERLLTGELQNIYSALILINTIINANKMPIQLTAEIFSKLCDTITKTGTFLVHSIIKELQELVKEKTDRNLVIANVYMGSTVLKVWIDIIEKFTTLLGKAEQDISERVNCLILMVAQDKILDTMSKILLLYLPTSDTPTTQHLFCASGVAQIDDNFNTMKMSVLECFNFVLDAIQSHRTLTIDPRVNKWFGFIRVTGIKFIIEGVINFCREANVEAIEDNNTISLIFLEALKFLTKLTLQQELHAVFLQRRAYLIATVCFPLLRTGTQEIVDFQEDPEQFAALALDTCQGQESETVKTQAAQFLEQLCQNIDGFLSFTIFMALQLIDFSLASDNIQEIPTKYPRLKDYQEFQIVANTNSEIRVETCVLVLSIISFQMASREELVHVERMFAAYHEYFAGDKPTPLLQSRLCLFFGFYITNLYKLPEQQEFFKLYLSFLVKCAGITDEESQSVSEQANYALNYLFDPLKGVNERLVPFIGDIFEKFALCIKGTESEQFFETLLSLTRTYQDFIKVNQQPLIEIIKLLVERAQVEYEEFRNEENPPARIHYLNNLNKMISAIRNIVQRPEYVERYQEAIEEILTPLFAHLESEEVVPFEEDAWVYMAAVIKMKKQVTPLCWTLFKLFPRMIQRSKGIIEQMFQPLNQLIIHGKQALNDDQEAIVILVNMLIDCLNPTSREANQKDVSEAALLLQLCMQYLRIPHEQWEKIILACLAKIKTIRKGFLLARLGGVFLIAFLVNFELTQAVIAHQNDLGYILHLLLVNLVAFESHRYDRKVFLIGFSHLLVQENLHEEILQRLPQIFGIIVPLFKYVETIEQIEVTKQEAKREEDSDDEDFSHNPGADPEFLKEFMKDMLRDQAKDGQNMLMNLNDQIREGLSDEEKKNDDTTDDDDDVSPDEFMEILTNEDEANKVLQEFETEFKAQDEFIFFREVIMKLKETNLARLEELYKSLSPQKQGYLKEALHSQRVVLNELEGTSQARRVVKARARKDTSAVQSNMGNMNNNPS